MRNEDRNLRKPPENPGSDNPQPAGSRLRAVFIDYRVECDKTTTLSTRKEEN